MRASNALTDEVSALGRLALPLAAVQAGNQLMSLVDAAIVGRLGSAELGAVGVANAIHFTFTVAGIGVMLGLDPLIAQSLGAGETHRAKTLAFQGFWLALGVGAVLTALVALTSLVLPATGVDADVARAASAYLPVRALGIVPLLWFVGARSYLSSVGRTGPMVGAMVLGNAMNASLAWLLVFGGDTRLTRAIPLLRSVPALGIVGAAWSTTACAVVQLLVLAPALASALRDASPGGRGPRRDDLARAAKLGAPIGLQLMAEVGVFALVGVYAARIGSVAAAAHQVALTLSSFSFTFCLGIASAASVRVGRAVGALDQAGVRRAGLVALGCGTAVMLCSALGFHLAPYALVRVITDRPEVIAIAAPLLTITAVFQVSDGLQAVGAGVLRGAGDTRTAFLANLVGHYAVGLPLALGLGFGLHMGLRGLWWGLCAGLTAVAVGLSLRFLWISARPIAPIEQP